MKRFFISRQSFDAYLLRDRLARAGIKAHVFNENMQGISGGVPPDVASPQVWLDDEADLARADKVLQEYMVERARTGTLHCRACGEDNPATFEICWQCGSAL